MEKNINQNLRILVIGDLMIDHYIYGNCNRISPEAPVPVVEVKNESYTLGGAGNVLENVKSLNCQADIISVIGDDDNAAIITSQLDAHGIDARGLVKDDSRCTTIKSRVLVSNHQLIRLDKEVTEPIADNTADAIVGLVKANIKKYDIVLLSDYNKGLLTAYLLKQLFAICREAGVKTIVDPKGLNFAIYQGADIIKPNKKEAVIATGIAIKDKITLEDACRKLREQTGCEAVVVTMSEEGMAFYSDSGLVVIPTNALGIIDVTGAGDTVLAALGVALAAGGTLYDACNFANHAAAVVVSKVGSATATLKEISERSN